MLKFAIIFIVSFILLSGIDYFLGDANVNIKHTLILSGLCTLYSYICQIFEMLSLTPLTGKSQKKYNLISFNDAVAAELIRIREDLSEIRIQQKNINKISENFLEIYYKYQNYRHSFLCVSLEKPADYSSEDTYFGLIMIVLDDDIDIGDYGEIEINSLALRKLNSQKKYTLQKGERLRIFLYETEGGYSEYLIHAKILSITDKDCEFKDTVIMLEIDPETSLDGLYYTPEDRKEPKKIRKFLLKRSDYYFIDFITD